MNNRVTLKDVAARAGVSRSSASLAVRGDGRLTDETRARVHQAIAELGYVYNRSAAALRSSDRRVIGVVVTSVANPFFAESTLAIETELGRLGYMALIANTFNDSEREKRILRNLQEFGVAAIVLAPAENNDFDSAAALEHRGIPCLSFTRFVGAAPSSYIGPDDVAGGQLAGEHLLQHGAKTLAYLGGIANGAARTDRIAGARTALRDANMPDNLSTYTSPTTSIGGLVAGRTLIASGVMPDGVICQSDAVAFGFYRALTEAGVTPPRITAFDDVELAAMWNPSLTTVSSHPQNLGTLAARMIVARLSGAQTEPVSFWTEPDLVVRESCGCPVA